MADTEREAQGGLRVDDGRYQPNCRSFTPLEVRVIIDALGEP